MPIEDKIIKQKLLRLPRIKDYRAIQTKNSGRDETIIGEAYQNSKGKSYDMELISQYSV